MHVWVANTVTGLLSALGGYSTVLTSFFAIVLANYQNFIFDKSMMKKMYFQLKDTFKSTDEDGHKRNDEDEIIERMNARKPYTHGYCGYLMMSITLCLCCCCKKSMVKKWPWYQNKWISYQKFKKARNDLNREKDIENVLYNLRILKFMQKTMLKKR